MNATDTLKQAYAIVRGNPAGVAAIDAEAQRKAEEAAAEAKKRAELMAKVDKALPERIAQVKQDHITLWELAIDRASEKKARKQLDIENGIIPPESLALAGGYPTHLDVEDIEREYKALTRSEPLPWAKGHVPAAQFASNMAREAAAARVDDVLQPSCAPRSRPRGHRP